MWVTKSLLDPNQLWIHFIFVVSQAFGWYRGPYRKPERKPAKYGHSDESGSDSFGQSQSTPERGELPWPCSCRSDWGGSNRWRGDSGSVDFNQRSRRHEKCFEPNTCTAGTWIVAQTPGIAIGQRTLSILSQPLSIGNGSQRLCLNHPLQWTFGSH